jgi:hypothetical protein
MAFENALFAFTRSYKNRLTRREEINDPGRTRKRPSKMNAR